MKIGSLFDGSGGFPLAATMCGVEPVWASEIEPYPIAVTRSRFPNMKHLGDISKINGGEVEPVDIITFGSPCQDLSVAGKRAGLKHTENGDEETTRSGLFMEAIRIIKEMRNATNGKYPRYAIWENVPGAFSSNKGQDFRIVLEELVRIAEPTAVMPEVPKAGWAYADVYCGNGWSLAYRVLDAQYWGVPQRRRRIYLVADFGGQRAGKILFEREGLRGYFAESGAQGESTSAHVEGSIGADDREGAVPYTLKIRGGVEVDSAGKAAGKGALIQKNLSATLAAAQDQYLFQPVADLLLDDQGSQLINVRAGVESAGFKAGQSMAGGIGWQEECAATLSAQCSGTEPTVCIKEQHLFENHSQDARYKGPLDVCPMLPAQLGTGGNNQPFVVEQYPFCKSTRARSADDATTWKDGVVANTLNTFDLGEVRTNELVVEAQPTYCLQGNGIDRADTAGCNGKGWKEDTCYTLNTIDRPAVVYAVDQGGGKSGANVSENKAPTLCTTHGGEPAICYKETYQKVTGPLMANSHPGSYTGQDAYNDMFVVGKEQPICVADHPTPKVDECGKSFTLNARDYKAPLCAAYGVDCRNFIENEELYPTLQAKSNGGQSLNYSGAVRVRYIVRRLTPTECARLQGFPDAWGHPDSKKKLTDDEYRFWLDVRNTHAAINGKGVKDYTKAQMLTWYNKLHTDSSEYKMWGNGIALPCALYVMQGIAEALYEPRN